MQKKAIQRYVQIEKKKKKKNRYSENLKISKLGHCRHLVTISFIFIAEGVLKKK